MKYIATVIFVLLLSWTWSLATTERTLKLEQHKYVEAGVEEDIRNFIQRRYPSTSEIYCQQLYTEVVQSGVELIARFRCQAIDSSVADDATEQVFEGFLKLRSSDSFATWSETGGEIRAKEIRFLNEFKVTPTEPTAKP